MKFLKKNHFNFDFGFIFIIVLFLANLIFLANANWVLFFVLIFLFYFLALFLIENFKVYIEAEKLNRLKLLLTLLQDIKNNFNFLEKINIQFISIIFLIISNLNLKFFNNILYKCVEIYKSKNYLFDSIFDIIDFYLFQQKEDLIYLTSKEDFLDIQ